MNDLDFYAQAATSGTVLGLGPGATPAQVEERLGGDFFDDRQRAVFRRDYGLLEISFYRDSSWVCGAISIQVHRLLRGRVDVVPPVLIEEFGEFSARIKFHHLERVIDRAGFSVVQEANGASIDFSRLRVLRSGVEIIVVGQLVNAGVKGHEPGDVWSILLPGSP